MNQSDLLAALQDVARGMAKLLGDDAEVVLHDLERREMVYIANGHITGRSVGYRMNDSVYDTILDLADQDGLVIGYGSHSANGKRLRSSHFVSRDASGTPKALICVNQDTTKLEELRGMLDGMIRMQPLHRAEEPSEEADENYIQKVTRQVIIDCIEKMKPAVPDTKDAKMDVLKKLEVRGVFAVKDAVPVVCKLLSISQATLYNYLRELRSQETIAGKNNLYL